MPFDFPSSPTTGQVFNAPTGQGYVYSGTAWNLAQTSPQAPVASDNPPANPYAGQLWLRSTTGALYMWYVDPNSSQWIQIPGIAPIADPYPFVTANMQLLSMGAGVVGLNTQKDGSGTSGKLWSDLNNSLSGTGYAKFANGLIVNWGSGVSNANGDLAVTFPAAFTNANYSAVGIVNTGSGVPAGNFYGATFCNQVAGSCAFQTRSLATGSVGIAGSTAVRWLAVGY